MFETATKTRNPLQIKGSAEAVGLTPGRGYVIRKRLTDLAICLARIPFVLPVIGICAVALWIENPGQVADEVRLSREILAAQTGSECATLAYPAGGVNSSVVSTIASEGFDLAFSTRRGVNDQSFHERFLLRRINVGAATTPGLLRMQLANWGR